MWPPIPERDPDSGSFSRRPLSVSDSDVVARASRARNGALFSALWAGDWKQRYGSQSEADLALCSLLGFWCDGDAARVDALFRRSGLYRDKWNRDDYRRWTLERACSGGRA
jgi:primase-polymerase (primpol)-like protein